MSALSRILGFPVNSVKTEFYHWTPHQVTEMVECNGVQNRVRPPILQYLGHILAHPTWAHKARADYLGLMQSDLAQSSSIPMNG